MAEQAEIPEGAENTRSDDDLERLAEEIARAQDAEYPENAKDLSPEAAHQLFHKLRVHQIELEIQNDELRRAQEEVDAARARYFELYDLAPVGYCSLNNAGLIEQANLTAADLPDNRFSIPCAHPARPPGNRSFRPRALPAALLSSAP